MSGREVNHVERAELLFIANLILIACRVVAVYLIAYSSLDRKVTRNSANLYSRIS